ncbi:MAG: hypothetical protein HY784_10410, partial [Chloroflexi bacterium]|nr:hypothetical protein [Chloroflexota bacterium]
IPLVLLSLALSASVWRGRSALDLRAHRRNQWPGVLLGIVFGGLAFENAWDLPTFSFVLCIAVLARNLRARSPDRALLATGGYLVPVFALAIVAYVPWYMEFSSQASGFLPYVGEGTRPAHAFLQFGPLLLAGALTLVPAARGFEGKDIGRCLAHTLWVPLIPFATWVVLAWRNGDLDAGLDARLAGGWFTLAAYGVAAWSLAGAFVLFAWRRRAEALPAGLAATGALLLFGAELFLIRDIFFGGAPRLNTVFKLTYQAWILLSAGGAVGLVIALRQGWHGRPAGWLGVPVGLLLLAGLVYPLTALPNRTGGFAQPTNIDGLAFLARSDPPEYALTRWVQDHTGPGDIIIEATGRAWRRGEDGRPVIYDSGSDYSDAGRISARTGRQTLIGWFTHEIQWRGENDANRRELQRRQDLVDSAYTSPDPARAAEVMRETGAKYLVVGRVELSRYPGDIMPRFESVLDLVFESDGLRAFRLPAGVTAQAQ